jgi:hypothetical protein
VVAQQQQQQQAAAAAAAAAERAAAMPGMNLAMKWRSVAAPTTGPKQQQAKGPALLLLLVSMLQLAVIGCHQHQLLLVGFMPAELKVVRQTQQATAAAGMAAGMRYLQGLEVTAARQGLVLLLMLRTAGRCLAGQVAAAAAAAMVAGMRALADLLLLLLLVRWIHRLLWMTF